MGVNKMCFLFVLPACNLCRTPPKYGALWNNMSKSKKECWPCYGQHSLYHWYLFFSYSLFDTLFLSIRSFLFPHKLYNANRHPKAKTGYVYSDDKGTFGYSTSMSSFKHHMTSSLLYCFYLNNHIECCTAMFSILYFHTTVVCLFKKALSSDASDSIICVKCTWMIVLFKSIAWY